MQKNDTQPDQFMFATILRACANLVVMEDGRKVHEDIFRRGFQYNVYVGTTLVDMYVKCGCIEAAR